jgi:hypothetical protein
VDSRVLNSTKVVAAVKDIDRSAYHWTLAEIARLDKQKDAHLAQALALLLQDTPPGEERTALAKKYLELWRANDIPGILERIVGNADAMQVDAD